MKDDTLPKDDPQKDGIIPTPRQEAPRIGTLRMVMRLFFGSAVIGQEELKNRFQEQQSETHVPAVTLNEVTPLETDADRVKYATLGAVAKSSNAMRRGVSTLGRITNRAHGRFTRAFSPIANSRPMSPVRRQYQRFIDRGDMIVSDWIATGRREEYLSRQLAQDTATEAIEETLNYLADSPELDELIQEQSGDLVEDIFEDASGGISKSSLILLDWINATVLRRPPHKPDPDADTTPHADE
ncbi:hypothetical protein ACFLY4_02510 [Chloroflexota bacterium]